MRIKQWTAISCGITLLFMQTGCLTQSVWEKANRENGGGPVYVVGVSDASGPRLQAIYTVAGIDTESNVYDLGSANDSDVANWPTATITQAGRATSQYSHMLLQPGRFIRTMSPDQLLAFSVRSGDSFAERLTANPAGRAEPNAELLFAIGSPTHSVPGGEMRTSLSDQAATQPTRVIAIPSQWARPSGQREKDLVRAAFLTPLTLLADVTVMPFVYVIGHAYGKGP